jgi:hypothetical protein
VQRKKSTLNNRLLRDFLRAADAAVAGRGDQKIV